MFTERAIQRLEEIFSEELFGTTDCAVAVSIARRIAEELPQDRQDEFLETATWGAAQ